jgi:serine/threonine protein kinase
MAAESDRYTLDDLIGEGGMALVYEATDQNLDRKVAVKVLRPELAGDPDFVARFKDEARIMGQLDHPGAIPVYETGKRDDDQLYLSMKRVRGETFEDRLNRRRPDDLKDHRVQLGFVDIFERVCQTMAAAHRQGIIHRDLKPDNIMIDDLGVVYVMDWGISKQVGNEESDDGRTRVGAVMGTPAYMSPELAMGKAAESDRQSDVFTLGAILYEILTGVQPFKKDSAVESMKGVLYHDPDEPRKVNRRSSRILSAICMKALNKDPYRRYRDAGELAQDIRAFREFQPVTAIKYGLLYRLWGWHQRRPVMTSVLGTLMLVVLIGLVGIGTSSSIDNVLVAVTYEDIEELQSQVTELEDAINNYNYQLADPALSQGERERLMRLRDGAEDRVDFRQRLTATLAYSIAGMTLFTRDARAEKIMYSFITESADKALEQGHYHRAHEILGFVLRTAGTARDPFNLTKKELAEMQRMYDDVEAELEKTN